MKRELVLTPRFKKAFRKFVIGNARLQKRLEHIMKQLHDDAFATMLGTHKLSGELAGLMACSCGYDCRIIFSIQKHPTTGQEIIILLDMGTHDEVY